MFRSKRVKILLAIALLVIAAWTGTTLSAYVKESALFPSGWVGPKYYAFEVDSSAGHTSLAPGESTSYAFTVKNYNSGGTAQVPLKVLINISYPPSLAGTGKLRADLYGGNTLLRSSDTGTLEAAGLDLAANVQETQNYTIKLTWVDADMALLGGIKGQPFDPQAISVRVSGYQ